MLGTADGAVYPRTRPSVDYVQEMLVARTMRANIGCKLAIRLIGLT